MKKKKIAKRRKHNIINIIGLSFQKWWNNFIIVLPFVFCTLASILVTLLLFFIFGLIFVAVFGSGPLDALRELLILGQLGGASSVSNETIQAFSGVLNPSTFFYFILMIFMFALILELVKAYFYSGAIAMASDIVKEKKTKLKIMVKNGRKFIWRYWFVKLIIALGSLLWLFIFSIPFLLANNPSLMFVPLISIIPLIFIYVLFMLSEYFVILENKGIWKAIGRSVSVVKENYWAMFGLALLFILIISIAGIIPWIGGLATLLIFIPCQTIAFVIFILERTASYRR